MKSAPFAIVWGVAIPLGALQAWSGRTEIGWDGISYLDMADALWGGRWATAINGYWSPLYAALLGAALRGLAPAPYWEVPVVHLVNFGIYLAALGCFQFLVRGLGLATRSFQLLAGALYLWLALSVIKLHSTTPDLLMAGALYLAAGCLVRVSRGSAGGWWVAGLGSALALGYLAKAILFPLAFVFLAVVLFGSGNWRRGLGRAGLAALAFGVLSGPWLGALARTKGRALFSDVGALNYAWYVNEVDLWGCWQGGPERSGRPQHAAQPIWDTPRAYHFAEPYRVTYPPWYEPSYWYEGVEVYFDLRQQLRAMYRNAETLYRTLLGWHAHLAVGALVLWWTATRPRLRWSLLLPAGAGLMAHLVVYVEPRHAAVFATLLWLGVFSSLTPAEEEAGSGRVASAVGAAMLVVAVLHLAGTQIRDLRNPPAPLFQEDPAANQQWQIAQRLARLGLRSGDPVALVATHHEPPAWARLGRLRIVAAVIHPDAPGFWMAPPERQAQAVAALQRSGARVMVTDGIPAPLRPPGWQRIGATEYWVYILGGGLEAASGL